MPPARQHVEVERRELGEPKVRLEHVRAVQSACSSWGNVAVEHPSTPDAIAAPPRRD